MGIAQALDVRPALGLLAVHRQVGGTERAQALTVADGRQAATSAARSTGRVNLIKRK